MRALAHDPDAPGLLSSDGPAVSVGRASPEPTTVDSAVRGRRVAGKAVLHAEDAS